MAGISQEDECGKFILASINPALYKTAILLLKILSRKITQRLMLRSFLESTEMEFHLLTHSFIFKIRQKSCQTFRNKWFNSVVSRLQLVGNMTYMYNDLSDWRFERDIKFEAGGTRYNE